MPWDEQGRFYDPDANSSQMDWTKLHAPEKQCWHSQPTQAWRDDLESKVTKLLADRRKVEKKAEALREAPIEELKLFKDDVRHMRGTLLQTEVRIRKEIAEWLDAEESDRREALDRARAAQQKIEDEVYGKLQSIGFEDSADPRERIDLRLTFVPFHPKVRTARKLCQHLAVSNADRTRPNQEALEKVQSAVEEIRAKMLADL